MGLNERNGMSFVKKKKKKKKNSFWFRNFVVGVGPFWLFFKLLSE